MNFGGPGGGIDGGIDGGGGGGAFIIGAGGGGIATGGGRGALLKISATDGCCGTFGPIRSFSSDGL